MGFNYIDTSPPLQLPSDGEHLHFNRFCFLPPPPFPPCLSRSLTLLDWTFLLQKQFSIIICNATPQCRMQMLALAAPAWQLPPEHRCRRPLRQNKVEGANNVITQSLHIGVHSLWAAVDSGHCWHRLGRDGDDAGCLERNAHNLISASVQDSPNSRGTPAECQRRKTSRDSQVESEVLVWRCDRKQVGNTSGALVVWCKGQSCCVRTDGQLRRTAGNQSPKIWTLCSGLWLFFTSCFILKVFHMVCTLRFLDLWTVTQFFVVLPPMWLKIRVRVSFMHRPPWK